MVNKMYEQYHHYKALFIVLLVRKIPKIEFMLSCTSTTVGYLGSPAKYYRLEVQPAYLVHFAQSFYYSLLQSLLFCTFNQPYTPMNLSFFFKNTFTFTFTIFYYSFLCILQFGIPCQSYYTVESGFSRISSCPMVMYLQPI